MKIKKRFFFYLFEEAYARENFSFYVRNKRNKNKHFDK